MLLYAASSPSRCTPSPSSSDFSSFVDLPFTFLALPAPVSPATLPRQGESKAICDRLESMRTDAIQWLIRTLALFSPRSPWVFFQSNEQNCIAVSTLNGLICNRPFVVNSRLSCSHDIATSGFPVSLRLAGNASAISAQEGDVRSTL